MHALMRILIKLTEEKMDPEAVISFGICTLWAAAGLLLGIVALFVVRKRRKSNSPISIHGKLMWYLQIASTPIAGMFVFWLTNFFFRGVALQLGLWSIIVLFVGSLLALPNAFWLLVETSPKPQTS